MYNFQTVFQKLGVKPEDVNYQQEHSAIYFTIIQYFRVKKCLQIKEVSNMESIEELRQLKNKYIYFFMERYEFIRDDKESNLYKVLRSLIYGLKEYVSFMNSHEDNHEKEYYHEYNIYTLIHLFFHIQYRNVQNPLLTISSESIGSNHIQNMIQD